jgi:hypothetical protein
MKAKGTAHFVELCLQNSKDVCFTTPARLGVFGVQTLSLMTLNHSHVLIPLSFMLNTEASAGVLWLI